MNKKILILTGSPRKNGNSDMLADAFTKGAQEKGHTVNKIEVAKLNISGCTACEMCWTKDGACVQCDDMAEIEPWLESADVFVLVSPLYFYGISAQLKAAVDRLCAYCVDNCKKPLKIKESALIMCGEGDEERFFSGAIDTYRQTAEYMKWKDRGILIATSVTAKGDVLQGDWLAKSQAFGASI
ncbi:MAG: flavodoxin family protein [Euryarchaeota archaeon]|nr:flavodoxin family protein [Euryarchaeota archaeon]